MEQAKHYKKYYGQRKTRMGYENLNTEHRQEYEKKNMKKRNIIQRKKNRNVGIEREGIKKEQ